MIELLSLICGGVFRLFPSFMDWMHKGQDNAHELAMVDKQIALAKVQAEQKLAEIHAQGDENRATLAAQVDGNIEQGWSGALADAIKSQGEPTGVAWVDALSASVRPVLTYWWCLVLYTAAKAVAVIVAFKAGASLADFAPILVGDFDKSVIGSIFGFWFVDRALRKMGR
jgi:hypothetical protein